MTDEKLWKIIDDYEGDLNIGISQGRAFKSSVEQVAYLNQFNKKETIDDMALILKRRLTVDEAKIIEKICNF